MWAVLMALVAGVITGDSGRSRRVRHKTSPLPDALPRLRGGCRVQPQKKKPQGATTDVPPVQKVNTLVDGVNHKKKGECQPARTRSGESQRQVNTVDPQKREALTGKGQQMNCDPCQGPESNSVPPPKGLHSMRPLPGTTACMVKALRLTQKMCNMCP